ncbi:MAG: TonB-dependent receptor, partial [Candidatus Acidiferrales bacterium]
LYPAPTNSSVFSNFASSPRGTEFRNAFDTRIDADFSQKDQLFTRFSWVDDPQLIPGPFGGIADGGGFQEGTQTAKSTQTVLGWTHVFSPNVINDLHAGFNYLHTSRYSPEANNLTDIPGTYGIQDIPQQRLNGGLPAFGINGLATLGSNAFLPSDEVTSTFQVSDDFTKIYGKHTFKSGIQYEHVKFSTLQPPWSRGEFDYNGDYTDVVNSNIGSTGRAQFLLTPETSTVPGGINDVGGSTQIYVSNISLTDNGKNYYGGYINDDWKITSRLTINLGVRWDYFGLVFEHHANQANFVPSGPPTGGPMYIIPVGVNDANLSPSFLSLLTKDGITLDVTNKYGKGLGNSQNNNFAPRLGFAYQITPKFVARGGFGIFYNGFENRGFSPNLGENYPFQFNFSFPEPNNYTPITFPGCPTAGPGGSGTFETGFSCTPLSPLLVNASGLALRGIQFNYQTPYSMGGNFTLQYQLTRSMSLQAGYVTSQARHLEVFPNSNNVTQLLPAGTTVAPYLPFPDFGQGSSYAATEGNSSYNGLQTKLEKQFSGGLDFLATYTWSKTYSDAVDLLNGGSGAGYRGQDIPGFGIQQDRSLAPYDIRNVFHFSGSYQLPFGKGKHFMGDATGATEKLVGGWSLNTIITLQGGQPITLSCPTTTAAGTGCYDLRVAGQNPDLGIHTDANGRPSWIGNAAAFAQPCTLGAGLVPVPGTPAGCVPLTGLAALGGGASQIDGPGFKRVNLSLFKTINLKEHLDMQFRTEVFNLFNHPVFNAPNFGGNGVVAVSDSGDFTSSNFGEIGSTRDAPYDARQIQFALKLLF